MRIHLTLCFLALFFFWDVCGTKLKIEDDSRSTFPIKRAVDGTRGSKYFKVAVDDAFDIYDAYDEEPDFSDYRNNIPGEPGLDYPSFTRIPQTSFTCEREYRGYYADEEAGCQLFHVCDGNFLVSSFLCPVGSTFSQKLLTCDWWNKVDCSTTRKFYQVNNQIIISQVDDDEILRKAYEMTSLQSTRNGIAVINPQDRFNNDVSRKLSHVNELQSGSVSQYSDHQNSPSITVNKYPQLKYSSRYSSALDQHDRDIDYYPRPPDDNKESSIQVETIGNDYRNDNDEQLSRFEPSYAPTVPTITTTTRRYYSPTIPPIIRSTPRPGKYDLDFESSDHLYSAKGKHLSSTRSATQSTTENIETILPTVTPPTLDTSTSFFSGEFPTMISDEISSLIIRDETNSSEIPSLVYQPPVNDRNYTISTDESELNKELSTVKFHAHTKDSLIHLNGNNADFPKHQKKSVVTNPSTEILPPFFHYSNVEQHDAVLSEKPERLVFNLAAIGDAAVASPGNLQNRSGVATNIKPAQDTVDEESSPFQVTVTLNNHEEFQPNDELLRSLIAKQDPSSTDEIGDIEIIKSDGYGNLDDVQTVPTVEMTEKPTSKVSNYSNVDSRNRKYFDIVPRPFSLRPPNIEIETVNDSERRTKSPEYSSSTTHIESSSIRSDVTPPSLVLVESNATTENKYSSVHSEKTEILQQLEQTFGQPLYKVQRHVIFDLPNRQRSVDFQNGEPIHLDTLEEETDIVRERNTTDQAETKIFVETELVPSLGFSLDTEEEREQYVDAVLRGLFKDINVTEVETKSVNISES